MVELYDSHPGQAKRVIRSDNSSALVEKEKGMTSKEFLTTGEAAALVNISRSTISRNFDKGIFQGKKNPVTGERLISRESLINFMKQYNLPVDSLALEKKRVLVGSPDDQLFSLLQRTLSEDDRIELERVVFGGDVLISCSKVRPDLLVLDEELPDISSMEIIRSLRRMGDQQALKIIGAGKVRSVRRCLDWGADEVLGKETLTREELSKTIYTFLDLLQEVPKEGQAYGHQRRWPRMALHLPLKIGVYSVRTPYRRDVGVATMENISLGGTFLSEFSLESGTIPCEPFRILLEADQKPLVGWKAHGKVVRLQSNGSVSAGIQFTRVPKTSMKMIKALGA